MILCGFVEKCVKLTRFHVMCRHFKSFYGDTGCGEIGEFHAQTCMSIVKVNNKKMLTVFLKSCFFNVKFQLKCQLKSILDPHLDPHFMFYLQLQYSRFVILAVVINTTRRADPKLCKRALELTCDLRVVAAIEPGCCWTRKTLVSRIGFKEKLFLKERKKLRNFFLCRRK